MLRAAWIAPALWFATPAMAQQNFVCEQVFEANRFIEGMNSVDQALGAFELEQAAIILAEIKKDLPCTRDRIHPYHLTRLGRQKALIALFDQDDLTMSYWAGLAQGELAWPVDMDEEHPLRRGLAELETPDVVSIDGQGFALEKNEVVLIDGNFAPLPSATVEQIHFVQVLNKDGFTRMSAWMDGTLFDEKLLNDVPTPTELPKWYEPPDPNLNPKDKLKFDEAQVEKRREADEEREAREREEELKRQLALDKEREKQAKRRARAEKRAEKLRQAAAEAEAAEAARQAALAEEEERRRRAAAADQWVGLDFKDDKASLDMLDNTLVAGTETAADCQDLKSLEIRALAGLLTTGHVNCLERRMRHDTPQTIQNKISRLLMADAWSKKEVLRWEAAVKRHLEEIDRSDPDLCYLYARHQAQQGTERVNTAIRWANVALANNLIWEGDTRITRMLQLHRLNARASQGMWLELEAAAAGSPDKVKRDKAEFWRNQTKSYAREWLEFALVSESDSRAAYDLCLAAAGTREYCDVR